MGRGWFGDFCGLVYRKVDKLIRFNLTMDKKTRDLLIEGYKVMAEENLRICKEWEHIDLELDWEWEGEL